MTFNYLFYYFYLFICYLLRGICLNMPVALEAACLAANWCADAAKICTDREMQMNNKLLLYQ